MSNKIITLQKKPKAKNASWKVILRSGHEIDIDIDANLNLAEFLLIEMSDKHFKTKNGVIRTSDISAIFKN